MAVILSMQDQLTQLNTNMERLIEQIASANNHRYGRSSEKLDVIAEQLELELIFNEAEALTEILYVVKPTEEDVIQLTRRKQLPDEVYIRVRVQPAVYTVEEHHVAVYAGKDDQTIVKGTAPQQRSDAIPGCKHHECKDVNGLPLYRISQEFLRNNIHISRQVMANWIIQCADRYLI